jgi:hypothetical protein
VWVDRNKDGKQDPDEEGIGGAVVIVTLPDGTQRETVTDDNGNYRFTDLPPGEYQVEVLAQTTPTNGPRVRSVTVASGDTILDVDFGFSATSALGVQRTGGDLAFTGSHSGKLGIAALIILAAGAILLVGGRRQHATDSTE